MPRAASRSSVCCLRRSALPFQRIQRLRLHHVALLVGIGRSLEFREVVAQIALESRQIRIVVRLLQRRDPRVQEIDKRLRRRIVKRVIRTCLSEAGGHLAAATFWRLRAVIPREIRPAQS
jgi:hypothetical protein